MNTRTADYTIAILQSKLEKSIIASKEADTETVTYLRDQQRCIKESIDLLAAIPVRNASAYAADILRIKIEQLKRADSFGNTDTVAALEEVVAFLKLASQ